jgi:Cdc6-like AAA superfamily ATPase
MSAEMEHEMKKLRQLSRLAMVFKPSTPVQRYDLFAGRIEQLMTLWGVLGQAGQHAMLYGERGVGKSSIANILGESLSGQSHGITPIGVNCVTEHTYKSLWRSILKRMGEPLDEADITVDSVVEFLEARQDHPLIIIDELDRFEDDDGLSAMADTIKYLSDHAAPTTIVLVGVGDSIDQLIGDHQSVERALVQVKMPRMSIAELRDVVNKGLKRVEMTIDNSARERIAELSEGLPSFTHLLALHAGEHAVQDDRMSITNGDVDFARGRAVKKAQHSILSSYENAVRSPREDNLFSEVLLACALAEKNELGYFTPKSVSAPLTVILDREIRVSAYVRHLDEFTSDHHSAVLQKDGQPRKYRFKFANPMLQPYVIIRGVEEGRITEEAAAKLRKKEPELFERF